MNGGAVAYLTHSQYGRNGKEIALNGPDDLGTGGGAQVTSYTEIENQKQSTTGNVYGIYDMSGGLYEFTAVWNNKLTSGMSYGKSFITQTGTSSKYATAYSNELTDSIGTRKYTVGKTGDATKEVYRGSGDYSWFDDACSLTSTKYPFWCRGGYLNSNKAGGIFYSDSASGGAYGSNGFRTVLCP